MAMDKKREQQDELFVPYSQMRSSGHPFYRALDRVLREHGLVRWRGKFFRHWQREPVPRCRRTLSE
jgi:hypothetical protein